jgi:hypothetical protein
VEICDCDRNRCINRRAAGVRILVMTKNNPARCAKLSGERTRLACRFRRLAENFFFVIPSPAAAGRNLSLFAALFIIDRVGQKVSRADNQLD